MTCASRSPLAVGLCIWALSFGSQAAVAAEELAELGHMLFFDVNLSLGRTQSCSTCHDPAYGLADSRDNGVSAAASLGDDGRSLGDRNAPTTSYVSLTPEFHTNLDGEYLGGFFHDGRSATLTDQASEPFLNPIEMRMPSPAAVVSRIRENSAYVNAFRGLFGESIFDDTNQAYRAIAHSLAAFEATAFFAPFDSKYDRYLRGEYQMTREEALGRELFFSQLTNCSNCHLLTTHDPSNTREPFTNYRYHNIGIPPNDALRRRNGTGTSHRDRGLLDNPGVEDASQAGKFKVPTLRNVAVTGPYMHNGVFQKLATAIHFYGQYTVRNSSTLTNPETGKPWHGPEFQNTIDLDLLRQGQPLGDDRVAVLEAFLRTLTDRRYEPLLDR